MISNGSNESFYNDSFTSFNENLFSTSPYVFDDIENIIENSLENATVQDDQHLIVRLRYDIVMKDIIIYSLQKKVDEYSFGHRVWKGLLNLQ